MLPKQRAVDLQPGPAQVTGQVKAAGPPLAAPISGRPCVYYQVLRRNHVWPWHDRPYYPPADVRFWLDDGSGQLLVAVLPPPLPSPRGPGDTDGAIECVIAGDGLRRTIYLGESPLLDRLLDPGGPFPPDAYLKVEERIIVDGDTLTIGGEVFEEITVEGRALGYRSPPMHMVLKAQSLRTVEKG